MTLTGFTHNVQWGEFSEINSRPANTQESAFISVSIRSNFRTQAQRGQDCRVVSFNTTIIVSLSASWIVRGQQTADLLRHEQGHYDITALGAREVHDRSSALTSAQCPGINREAQRIERDVQTRINQANQRYDTQTNHGINASDQQRWNTSIRNAKNKTNGTLADLPQYKKTDAK